MLCTQQGAIQDRLLVCVGVLVSVRSGRLVVVYTAGSHSRQTVSVCRCVGVGQVGLLLCTQ